MVADHVSDFLTQVRNAYIAGKPNLFTSAVKIKLAVANVLAKHGYIESVHKKDNQLEITLKYAKNTPAIMGLRRVSKPGARIYVQIKNLPRVWGGLGVNILSTPKGVMSDKEAKKLHLGGELLAQVW